MADNEHHADSLSSLPHYRELSAPAIRILQEARNRVTAVVLIGSSAKIHGKEWDLVMNHAHQAISLLLNPIQLFMTVKSIVHAIEQLNVTESQVVGHLYRHLLLLNKHSSHRKVMLLKIHTVTMPPNHLMTMTIWI